MAHSPESPEPGRALVTGASRGIGRAIAERLARRGVGLALVARDARALDEVRGRVEALGAACRTYAADLRDPSVPARIVAEALADLGGLDTLVNNAGTAPSDRIEHTSDQTLDEVLDLHVKAPFRLVRALLPHLRGLPAAWIVQVASSAGLRGFPFTAAYGAAKHAMVGLTRALGAELASTAIRVRALCPGFVDTEITRGAARAVAARGRTSADEALRRMGAMNRLGRMLTADEVAAAVEDLLFHGDGLENGAVLDLDCLPPRPVHNVTS
ncbi:MAG: SDR family oxidoreductase [Planctomycetes bacterium]|nr:SDR family oxidoreductase [Planctomycetota bacterium]